jgi:hypothetical protein
LAPKLLSTSILIASVLLLSAVKNAHPSPSPQPIAKPSEHRQFTQNQPHEHPTPIGTPNLFHAPDAAGASNAEQDHSYDTSTKVIAASAAISAIAALLLVWFNCQLVGVTKDLQKASEAALDVNRPFLLVTNIASKVSHSDPNYESDLPALEYVHHFYFDVAIKNFGVSPADILDYTSTAEPLDPPKAPNYIDPPVCYPKTSQLNDSIIGPGEPVSDRIKATWSSTEQEYKSLCGEKNQRIAVYGRIRYRGASEKTFETFYYWWCYLTDPAKPDLHRCNTKKWNDHT